MPRESVQYILQPGSPRAPEQFTPKHLRLRSRARLNQILHAVCKGLQAIDESLHLLRRGLTQGGRRQGTPPDGELVRDSCQVAEMQHTPETLPLRRRAGGVPLQRRGKICASAKETPK